VGPSLVDRLPMSVVAWEDFSYCNFATFVSQEFTLSGISFHILGLFLPCITAPSLEKRIVNGENLYKFIDDLTWHDLC
jgi:hypothetical protein